MADDTEQDLRRRVDALEARLRQLEDERALRDLMAAYSFTADLHRGAPWVDLWTADGVYELGQHNVSGAYQGRFAGPEELLALITGPGMPPPGRSQHHVHGPVVFRVDGDRAEADGYSVTFVRREGEENAVWNLGFNRWTFRREDGRWRIAERQRREIGDPSQASVIAPPA